MPQEIGRWRFRAVLAALCALVVLAAVWLFMVLLAEPIPPVAMTRTRIRLMEHRVREYAAKYHRLPASLTDLPELEENRDSSTSDGWGRPIEYVVKDRTATLLSLGEDGQLGGTGEASDIQIIFTVGDGDNHPLDTSGTAPSDTSPRAGQ